MHNNSLLTCWSYCLHSVYAEPFIEFAAVLDVIFTIAVIFNTVACHILCERVNRLFILGGGGGSGYLGQLLASQSPNPIIHVIFIYPLANYRPHHVNGRCSGH